MASIVARALDEKRHAKAELEHLQKFFLLWCEMHAAIADKEASLYVKQEAAQALTDQARKLKVFYAD
jgi:hypothetical protein